jgi:hypothetical protein
MIHLQQLKKSLEEYEVLICFSGRFSQGIVEQLCEFIKGQMTEDELTKYNPMKVISIFVEQAQNIISYNLENVGHRYYDQLLESSIVTIGKSTAGFFVTSGNILDRQDLDPLVKKIEFLNSLGSVELKQYYKEVMRRDDPGVNGRGAGLGLIQMARIAKSPLEYMNYRISDQLTYFQINVNC